MPIEQSKRINVWANQKRPLWMDAQQTEPKNGSQTGSQAQQTGSGGDNTPSYDPIKASTFTAEELGLDLGEQQPANQGLPQSQHRKQVEWARDNTKPDGGAIDFLATSMGHYTTPEEEERYRKRARNKAAIIAVGDAIRNIGNIYYTSKYATPQRFNQPVNSVMGRYAMEKANRDNVNYRIEKMQREAEKIKADADFKNRQLANQADYNKGRLEEATRHNKANEGVAQGRVDETVRHNKENEGIARGRAEETARHNSVTERQGAQRIAIQKGNADETRRHHAVMESRGSSTGGGRGGRKTEPYHISSGRTTLGRSKELSKQETDDIYNYLMRNKKIHPDTDRNVRGVRVVKDKNGNPIINPTTGKPMETKAPKKYTKREVIEFALYNDPSFGNYLINEYGYRLESGTLEAPRKPTRPAAEKNTRQQNARKETSKGNAFSKYGGTQITSK